MTDADKANAAIEGEETGSSYGRSGPSQATQLIDMVGDVDLWHTPEAEPFGTFEVNGHRENWSLGAKPFRQLLRRWFYEEAGKVPNAQSLQDALDTLGGKALFDGPEHHVHVRVGDHEGRTYIDLANESWESIEVGAGYWRIVSDPPVKFRRPRGMQSLPNPSQSGNLEDLRILVNVATEDDWRLIVSWLTQAYRPSGPYPILALYGEQGSAKSTLVRILRLLVDPSVSPLRSQPGNERDLIIAATNGWIVALDNMSSLPIWLSDALCRLATGGGLSTRALYTDDDEKIFDAQRPAIINGINELAVRGDILDRSIPLVLPTISDNDRRRESEFWAGFDAVKPSIFGGLLDGVAGAMANLDVVQLETLPRMADFAVLGVALEMALGWPEDSFIKAYMQNRGAANETALEASLIATPLLRMDLSTEWNGTAANLLSTLESMVEELTRKRKQWPADPRGLSAMLRRLAPNLRSAGIVIEFDSPRRRHILIRKEQQSSDISDTATSERPARRDPTTNGDDVSPGGTGLTGSPGPVRVMAGEQHQDLACVADVAELPTHSNDDQPAPVALPATIRTESDDDVGDVLADER